MKGLEKPFKALANRRRLAILKHLKENEEASVSEIAKAIGLSFRSTSRHLGVLSAVDILERDQRGLWMFYRLSDNLNHIIKQIITIL